MTPKKCIKLHLINVAYKFTNTKLDIEFFFEYNQTHLFLWPKYNKPITLMF